MTRDAARNDRAPPVSLSYFYAGRMLKASAGINIPIDYAWELAESPGFTDNCRALVPVPRFRSNGPALRVLRGLAWFPLRPEPRQGYLAFSFIGQDTTGAFSVFPSFFGHRGVTGLRYFYFGMLLRWRYLI